MSIHVVLVHPEIHWNTGNAGRTCLAVGHARSTRSRSHRATDATSTKVAHLLVVVAPASGVVT